MNKDTNKETVRTLKHDAVLIRFNNPADVEYSAIILNGIEIASCERPKENNMIEWFENSSIF